MTKAEYSSLLKRKEWKTKRNFILKRDNYCCKKCGDKQKLQVHHIFYIEGNMPWEVPNNYLITVCETCHIKIHENCPIHKFIKRSKNTKKKNKNGKINKKKNKKPVKLNKRDSKLQDRYNKLRREGKIS